MPWTLGLIFTTCLRIPHRFLVKRYGIQYTWELASTSSFQNQNDYIREWLPQKEEFLRIIMEMEAPPEPRVCSRCEKDGVYRCIDCIYQPLCCTDCCRALHEFNPFHRIQQWTGECFERSALHTLGLSIDLGHSGATCPSRTAADTQNMSNSGRKTPKDMPRHSQLDSEDWEDIADIPLNLQPPVGSKYLTIVDVTGIHYMVMNSCECPNAECFHLQLLRAKLWPSTFQQPSTAFTFAVLDDFLRDNLECGTSAMNYFSKLRRITSGLFPHLVPDRYRELLRVARQWRLIKLCKWNAFRTKNGSANKGDLALFCAACPQPGINVDTKESLDHWKYSHTMVMDGNFKAEHMKERRPHDQVWLMDGQGYMVTYPEYHAYLKATPHITEKSNCSNHKALSHPNADRGKLDSMGIGATACARHGCFYPHSVVDFQKGERQLNMDYSLANALGYNMAGIQNVICFYDVNCSYMKNLRKRVGNSIHIQIPSSVRIVPGIGIWHVHGHKKECYSRYSPLFIKGAGWVDGEIIETLWSMLNVVSTSARGMSAPHRQELLDFQMNDSNFMKMIRQADSLARKLKAARTSAALARAAFAQLDATTSPENRQLWESQEEAAMAQRVDDCTVMDIFESQWSKAPTAHGVELQLLQSYDSSKMPQGAASWLARGLKIQEAEIMLTADRKGIGKNASEVKKLAVARRADRLATDRSTFLADAAMYIGEAAANYAEDNNLAAAPDVGKDSPIVSEDDDGDISVDDIPELQRCPPDPLPLPSALGIAGGIPAELKHLAEIELKLRIGQANDALHGLRLALVDKAVIFRSAVRPARNYSMKTRAWAMIHMAEKSVARQAKIYQMCRRAMVALGAGSEILSRYQELEKGHLTVNTAAFQQNDVPHRQDHLPWFWSIDNPKQTESRSWMSEFYRIHWLRAKAVRDRWEEEEELLISEFQWTANFFKHRAGEWSKLKISNDQPDTRGRSVYAARQQQVYERLAEHCAMKWQAAEVFASTFPSKE
ncbi:hypothetical protein EDD15DRAFT_2162788 [Pisolithus albus]|nr:hypothetical protein EDD15DRAFT_2162788 [Pisolithus albus]